MTKRSIVSLLLALMMLLSVTPALAEEPVTIHVYGLGATIPETDPVLPELGNRLGLRIVVDTAAGGADAATGLMTRMMDNDIPDVFRVGDLNNLAVYHESDAVLDLTPYLDQIPSVVAAFPETDWARLTIDGGIYGIPRRGEVNYMDYFIRKDWMEKLGAKYPTTFDELYDLCVQVRDADLDGNGVNDTYPISGSKLESRAGTLNMFFTAYGVTQPNTLMIKDNQVVWACTDPAYKLALTEIRRFMEAGLIDPEFVSMNEDTLREKMSMGKVFLANGGWCAFAKQAQQDVLKAVDANADWGHIESNIVTEYGTSGATHTAANFSNVYSFSPDLADEPEKLAAALSIFEYTISGAGDELLCYGLENVHYTKENGVITKLPAMNELGYGWAIQFTGRDDMVYCMTKFAECADEIEHAANEVPILTHYEALVSQPEGVNMADLKAYESEQLIAFIYGTRPMEEYDDFVQELYHLYNLGAYLDAATATLTELGYIK